MTELTQERLKELLHYNPETGLFTRKVDRMSFKIGSIAGSPDGKGYIRIKIDYKQCAAHRLAFLYMTGKFPESGLQVDHINHVKDDNRWVNLRLVTNQENHKNRPISKRNTTGCQGVNWNKNDKVYRAGIRVNGKQIHLGSFNIYEDAVKARKAAEIKYNFHENHGQAI